MALISVFIVQFVDFKGEAFVIMPESKNFSISKVGALLLFIWVIALSVFYAFGYVLLWRRYEIPHLIWMLSDDFYYYAKVAQNIFLSGESTYNGVQLTNGYHPLWMGVISGLGYIMGGVNGGFFVLFRLLLIVLSVLSAVLLFVWCGKLFKDGQARAAVFVYSFFIICKIIFCGMEVSLTVPLLLSLLLLTFKSSRISLRRSVLIGVVSAAIILSRIDMLIFILPYLFLLYLEQSSSHRIRNYLLCNVVCVLPFIVYLVFNHTYFDTWLPVSGSAKQLKAGMTPSLMVIQSVVVPSRLFHVYNRLIPLSLIVLGLVVVGLDINKLKMTDLKLVWVLFYPLVFWGILIFRYNYPFEGWYLIPFIIASVVACHKIFLFVERYPFCQRRGKLMGQITLLIILAYITMSVYRHSCLTPPDTACYYLTLYMRDFTKNHPGRYAMGDRAGLTGFVCDVPIIQLEGLMGDHMYLDYLRREVDIDEVFTDYDISYYVTTKSKLQNVNGVYSIEEPTRVAKDAPKVHGELREEPVLHERFANGTIISIFNVQDRVTPN